MATKGKTTTNKDNEISVGLTYDDSGIRDMERSFKRAMAFVNAFATSMKKVFSQMGRMLGSGQSGLNMSFDTKDLGIGKIAETVDATETARIQIAMKKLEQAHKGYYYSAKESAKAFEKLNDEEFKMLEDSKNMAEFTTKSLRSMMNSDISDGYKNNAEKISDANGKIKESFELIDYAAVGVFRKILNISIRIYKKLSLAGSNMVETNSRFNYVLGSLSKEAEKYAEAIANAYAITETEAKTAMTRIYQMSRSAGLSSSTALKMAKDLTIVGAELSSVWDVSTEQSVNALISALQGLPKAAKNLGVFTNVTEYKELLKEAGIAVDGTLTQNEKITGAFLKILKDSGYAIGDFARTQTSVANQLRLVNSAITSISENLGATMNTVLSPLLQVVNFFLKYLVRMTNILNDMPEPIKMVVGLFTTMAITIPIVMSLIILLTRIKKIYKEQVDQLTASLAKQTTMMGRLGNAMFKKVIPGFVSVSKIAVPFAIFIGSIITLFQKLNEKTEDNKVSLEDYQKAIEDSQRALAGYDDVNVMNFDSKTGLDASNLESIMDTLGINTAEIDEMGNKFIWLYGIMAVGSGVATVANIIKSWKNIRKNLTALRTDFGKFVLSFQMSLESLATRITLSTIGFVAMVAAIALVVSAFSQDWSSQANKWIAIIGGITAAVGALIFAIGVLKKNALQATIGGLIATGGFGDAIGAFAIDDKASIIPKNIPKAATGGTTTGATHALVGEGRYREAIIPLGNSAEFASMKRDITSAVLAGLSASGGSNGNINITVNVDEDYIYKAYNRQKELRGV